MCRCVVFCEDILVRWGCIDCVSIFPFLQRVQDTICINPGQLCKGESGGTYASLTIFPLSKDKVVSSVGEEISLFVPDRTMVEIKRI